MKLPVLDKPVSNKDPILSEEKISNKDPVLLSSPKGAYWAFSFRNWKQIHHFGLDQSQPKWFVSLLEKLKELSGKAIDEFLSDNTQKNHWRYHSINWNQTNIPVQKNQLDWIDPIYRNNEEEYPLLQFQVSKALGRVIGFWDEKNIFNIVLLDPLHNIQPSKSHGYTVNNCNPLDCQYTSLLKQISDIKNSINCDNTCQTKNQISSLPFNNGSSNVIMHYISDDDISQINAALQEGFSYTELLLLAADELKPLKRPDPT